MYGRMLHQQMCPALTMQCRRQLASSSLRLCQSLERLREYRANYTQLFPTLPVHLVKAREAGDAASHRTLNPRDGEEADEQARKRAGWV